MLRLMHTLVIGALLFLSACQSTPSYHTFIDGNLRSHNIYLTDPTASFDNKTLTIEGGIRNIVVPSNLACGHLEFEVFNQKNILLKTLKPEYSPCILHHRPKAKRTGHFSVADVGIDPQPLTIKVFYREKK